MLSRVADEKLFATVSFPESGFTDPRQKTGFQI